MPLPEPDGWDADGLSLFSVPWYVTILWWTVLTPVQTRSCYIILIVLILVMPLSKK